MKNENTEQDMQMMCQPPKGVGISSKVLWVVVCAAVVLSVLVISMIFGYHGKKEEVKAQDSTMMVDQRGGITPEDAIDKLNKEATYGVLARKKQVKVKATFAQVDNSPQQPFRNNIKDQEFKQAASSGISVINNFSGPASIQQGKRTSKIQENNNRTGKFSNLEKNILAGIHPAEMHWPSPSL